MIIDKLDNWTQYSLGTGWQKAFEYLQTLSPTSEDGEFPIDGDLIFARIMSYPTKLPEVAAFEAHEKYADIQMTLIGAEGIAWAITDTLEISKPYNEENDVAFFKTPETNLARVDNLPGNFTFLLPQDAHMPQLQVGESMTIKKVVVKIALTELELSP